MTLLDHRQGKRKPFGTATTAFYAANGESVPGARPTTWRRCRAQAGP